MHATQELRQRLQQDRITAILLRRDVKHLGDELYQLTRDDADWEAFWQTVADNASMGEIYEALVGELERRRQDTECTCHERPDGPQCKYCAARAAEGEIPL